MAITLAIVPVLKLIALAAFSPLSYELVEDNRQKRRRSISEDYDSTIF